MRPPGVVGVPVVLFAASALCVLAIVYAGRGTAFRQDNHPLNPETYHQYFLDFAAEEKLMLGHAPPVPWEWFKENIPWLDVPNKEFEQIYYFRWYSFQKHIKQTPYGFVIDEFLYDVPWAGRYNTISAAAGHHLREARWLRNPVYANEYANFWLSPAGEPRLYSFWLADSVYQVFLATGDRNFVTRMLPRLQENYLKWENTHGTASGLYWQTDDRDGMEMSVSGDGFRPTINSYMYGDAMAIAQIAEMTGQKEVAAEYREKAQKLQELIESRLWNPEERFYETVKRGDEKGSSSVRELIGYVPWYFDIPSPDKADAWNQLQDPQGFAGAYGPTTAERRSPLFMFKNPHECLWNGPSWPFATTQTLVAMANLLNGNKQSVVSSKDYFALLSTYTRSQHIQASNGDVIPWIDEDLDADTGEWLARDILISRKQPPPNRGRYYNHSGYADLLITGLLGLRPSSSNSLDIHALVPSDWNYFALDGLPYHGHLLTVTYDKTGERYHLGSGLSVFVDGKIAGHRDSLGSLTVSVPDAQETARVH
jgi:hypothetical protein